MEYQEAVDKYQESSMDCQAAFREYQYASIEYQGAFMEYQVALKLTLVLTSSNCEFARCPHTPNKNSSGLNLELATNR